MNFSINVIALSIYSIACSNVSAHVTPLLRNYGASIAIERASSSYLPIDDNLGFEPLSEETNFSDKRRQLMRRGLVSTIASFMFPTFPLQAFAGAAPITVEETQNLNARVKRAFRSQPFRILRPRMNLDFAVLLMRSSYNALDEIDCVPMDQFQRDFFLIRQAEYQPYVDPLGSGFVQQGDLTDPYYFDFISFAQYTTISREISMDPPSVFTEKQPVQVPEGELQKFDNVVVRRDPTITNSMLPMEHSQRVGGRIFRRLQELYGDTPSAIPTFQRRPNSRQLLAALEQLVKLFVINGYALDGTASLTAEFADHLQISLSLTSPATIWGGQALIREHAVVTNHFLLKTATILAETYGYEIAGTNVKYDGINEVDILNLR